MQKLQKTNKTPEIHLELEVLKTKLEKAQIEISQIYDIITEEIEKNKRLIKETNIKQISHWYYYGKINALEDLLVEINKL